MSARLSGTRQGGACGSETSHGIEGGGLGAANSDAGSLETEEVVAKLGLSQAHGRSVVLAEHERAALNVRAGKGLMGVVVAQGALALIASGIAWAIAGHAAGLSALAGAGAYFLPNTLFALRLLLNVYRPGGGSPYTFLLGEMLKIGLAVVLLWVTVRVGGDRIVWPALLAGLFSAMKGYVLLLMFRRL